MTPQPRSGRPSWVPVAARVGLAVGLLGFALWTNRDQVLAVAGHRPDLGRFALAFGLYAAGVLLAYARWFLLVRALGLPFRPVDALRLGLIGTLFNLVIPGGVGGDVVKAAYLCREQDRKAQAVASVFVDRVVGLMGLFLLAVVTGAWFWGALAKKVRGVVLFACGALAVTTGLLALAFVINPRGPLARRFGHHKRFAHLVAELHAAGTSYRRHFGVVALGVLMGAITHSGNVLAFYAVNRALFSTEVVPTLAQHFMIVPIILLSTAIPLPFGALGATEQISATLLRLGSYRGGAVAMMGFRCLQYLGATVSAPVYIANKQQVRELAESAEELDEAVEAAVGG